MFTQLELAPMKPFRCCLCLLLWGGLCNHYLIFSKGVTLETLHCTLSLVKSVFWEYLSSARGLTQVFHLVVALLYN